jgi:Voltage-dependent anion channel
MLPTQRISQEPQLEAKDEARHLGLFHLNDGNWRYLASSLICWTRATGTNEHKGIANVIATVPAQYRFQGLDAIGTIFFLLNLVFYLVIWTMIGLRFFFFPATFKNSFTHPTESLFAPATAVSFGTILINIVQYGMSEVGSWLSKATYVLFWLNVALAIILSISIYLIL